MRRRTRPHCGAEELALTAAHLSLAAVAPLAALFAEFVHALVESKLLNPLHLRQDRVVASLARLKSAYWRALVRGTRRRWGRRRAWAQQREALLMELAPKHYPPLPRRGAGRLRRRSPSSGVLVQRLDQPFGRDHFIPDRWADSARRTEQASHSLRKSPTPA